MLCALGYLLNTTLFAIFNIDAPILSNLCGLSLLPILFIYGAAEVFEFCNYHKMFIYYIGVMFLIDTFDYYIGIPLKAFQLIVINCIISGIFLYLIIYYYVKHHKENS